MTAAPRPDDATASVSSEANRAVLGRGSLYTIGTAAPILAQLAVLPAVTRLLGPDGYGVVAPLLVVLQITMMLAGLGFPAVITRFALIESTGARGAAAMMLRGIGLTVAAVGLALLTSPLWGQVLAEPLRALLPVTLLAGALFVLVETNQAFLRAMDRPLPFVALSAIAALGGPVLGLALLRFVSAEPVWYLGGLAAGYGLAGLVGLGLTQWRAEREYQRGDLGRALRLGLPMLPHMVALYLATGALVLIATVQHGLADAGRLQLALFIGSSPAVVTSALNNSWAPTIFRTAPEHRGAVVQTTATTFATLSGLLAGGVSLLSPWLLALVADSRYSPDQLVLPVAVAAVGGMLSVGYLASTHLVFALGRPAGLSVTTPLALLTGLAVAWVAGQWLGLVGVAAGFPATYLALVTYTALLRRRVGAPHWNELVLLAPFAVGALFIAAGALLPTTGAASLVRVLVAAVAGVLVLRAVRRVFRPA